MRYYNYIVTIDVIAIKLSMNKLCLLSHQILKLRRMLRLLRMRFCSVAVSAGYGHGGTESHVFEK